MQEARLLVAQAELTKAQEQLDAKQLELDAVQVTCVCVPALRLSSLIKTELKSVKSLIMRQFPVSLSLQVFDSLQFYLGSKSCRVSVHSSISAFLCFGG